MFSCFDTMQACDTQTGTPTDRRKCRSIPALAQRRTRKNVLGAKPQTPILLRHPSFPRPRSHNHPHYKTPDLAHGNITHAHESVILRPIYLRRRRLCFKFGLFVCLSVCLSVCPSDYSQTCERILTKFFGGVGHGSRTK